MLSVIQLKVDFSYFYYDVKINLLKINLSTIIQYALATSYE